MQKFWTILIREQRMNGIKEKVGTIVAIKNYSSWYKNIEESKWCEKEKKGSNFSNVNKIIFLIKIPKSERANNNEWKVK